MNWLETAWPGIILGVNLLFGWGLWSIRQTIDRKLSDGLKQIFGRLDAHEGRITRVEERVQSGPSDRDIGMIREQLAGLHGDLKAATATMNGITDGQRALHAATNRLNEYLLNQK